MIKGVGVDIIEIDRIRSAVEKLGISFLNRIYTKIELEYCSVRKSFKYPELAVRFAAKEAYMKALGVGMVGIKWTDVEIRNDRKGKPVLYYKGKHVKKAFVSLSHSRNSAIAAVIIESP